MLKRGSDFLIASTLVEMLLAVAILATTTVLAAQIINSASAITQRSLSKMKMDAQARTVFDRLSLDFKGALSRPDIDYWFQKSNGNDLFAFYSQASGFYPPGITGLKPRSPISLIGYRIENNQLERLGKALVWNGVTNSTPSAADLPADGISMVFTPITLSTQWDLTATGVAADPDYQVLSCEVFRMEFCFLTKDVTYSSRFDPKNSTAIVLTLAIAAKGGSYLSQLAATLPDGDDPGVADQWAEALAAMSQPHGGTVPEIRVYQRIFKLGTQP